MFSKEEHRLPIPPVPQGTAFTALWTTLAREQHFLQLTFDATPTHEQVIAAVQNRSGNLSPYTSTIFETYYVIHRTPTTVLLTNQTYAVGRFFAVQDAAIPHRYIVFFAFTSTSQDGPEEKQEHLAALVVYLDKGFCDAHRTIITPHPILTYDTSYGHLRDVFLYHQTLVLLPPDPDTQEIYLYHIPYRTEEVSPPVRYALPAPLSVWAAPTLFRRYLDLPMADHRHILDLGSLEHAEDALRFHTYRIPTQDMLRFLDISRLYPEAPYTDGYPLTCEQCHERTVAAIYTYKGPHHTIQHGLGSSYCPACRIRYSNHRQAWVCAQIDVDGTICDGLPESGHEARHAADQTLIVFYDPVLLKYPFREKVRLQWLPADASDT
jgi:hypothetical protein